MKIKRSEIDAAVAVEVMGWVDHPHGFWVKEGCGNVTQVTGHTSHYHKDLYKPSVDARHALEALEKVGMYGIEKMLNHRYHVWTSLNHFKPNTGEATHESREIACCLCALSAVRGETVELED
jgi:hypothetical protein